MGAAIAGGNWAGAYVRFGWKADILSTSNLGMSGEHNKIIAAAARAELGPLGFKRKGQSRLWLRDHGFWLNIVAFTPSRWSVTIDLDNAAHWIWAGTGFTSLNYNMDRVARTEFENEDQFSQAVTTIAQTAASRATRIEEKFPNFEAIAHFVVERARSSPDRMGPSWWGYEAGIASALIGRSEDAQNFLHGLTDERVTKHAAPLLPLIDRPELFKGRVNEMVAQQRAALKLPALDCPAF